MPTRFETDTALREVSPGVFEGRIDRGWWIEVGPNGGYVAALVLRGLSLAVGEAARTPRSFTIHYLAPPVEGPVTLHTTIERHGRRLTFVSGRAMQGDRLVATAMAAFAGPIPGPEFMDLVAPDAPKPDEVPMVSRGDGPELIDRYEMRWCIGAPPWSAANASKIGGWIRLREAQPVDHVVVAALTDAWMPPVFTRLDSPIAVPTIDLTIHFRSELPHAGMADDAHCLVVFRSQMSADGFVEEDGEVWSPDGVLLAHSRQLAVTLTPNSQ
ncbi:MAG: acyl-CoA thioesterase [Acidimicrobiia bacterium]|nr:acyl-CoA thioesterase [Acidimicrobiia bacterium]